MMNNITFVYCILCLIAFIWIGKFARQVIHILRYKSFVEMTEYFLEQAYESIYKQQILAFTASGFNPDTDSLETIKRNFVKLTLQLMGPVNSKILSRFYGGGNILVENMLVYLQFKMDNDQILDYARRMNEQKDQE